MILTNNIAIEGLIKEIINNGDSQTVRMESGEQAVYKKTAPRIPESMIGEKTVLSCRFVPSAEDGAGGHLLIDNVYVALKASGQDVIREAIKSQIKHGNTESTASAIVSTRTEVKDEALPGSEDAHANPIAHKIRAKINEKIATPIEDHPRIDPQDIELIEPSIRREKAHEDDIVMQPVVEDQPLATTHEKAEELTEKVSPQAEPSSQESEKKVANPFPRGAQERLPTNKRKSLLPGSAQSNAAATTPTVAAATKTQTVESKPQQAQALTKGNAQAAPQLPQAAPQLPQAKASTKAYTPSPVLGKRPSTKVGIPSVPTR